MPLAIAGAISLGVAFGDLEGVFPGGLEHPAIEYASRPERNVVTALESALRSGKLQLRYEGTQGYLRAVLAALDVPVESQLLVFSRTSLMASIIGPRNPRSIFFNDSVAVAWVPGEPFVELAAEDPQQGAIFYTLRQDPDRKPSFARDNSCLQCHESNASLGVPGTLVRSVFPAADGYPNRQFGEFHPDHRTPLRERWGGWYVTGRELPKHHMGNSVVANSEALIPIKDKFNPDSYLSPTSDVVALMVFDHQMRMINLLTRVGWEVRLALYNHEQAGAHLEEMARELVDYLLFVDEAPLENPVQGSSGFAEKFAGRGPQDHQGRSLRQFDLQRRLMRYPCSYMIYSEAFDTLPVEARDAVYRRMWRILSGTEKDPRYLRLTDADRRSVVEILLDTKKDLPDYFTSIRPQSPAR